MKQNVFPARNKYRGGKILLALYLMSLESDSDRKLFEHLYNEYRNKLYYIAYNMLRNEGSAEDAVHDSYIKAINHIGKFYDISEEHRKNLIILILKNTVRDMIRHDRTEPAPLDEEEYQYKYNLVFNEDYSCIKNDIKDCLQLLDEKYRTVLEMKYYHGLKEHEIADILNIGNKAVNSRIFRAKKMLADIMSKRGCENYD